VIDPFLNPKKEKITIMDLKDALPVSDIIILHASGDEQLIGEDEFSMMKPGVFLCNAARGQNINEPALIDALNNGTVAGAWLDSFSCEPYQGTLCDYANVIMTPHVGSYTTEGRFEMEMETAHNLINGLTECGVAG
jgi:D-3-phosphoglycerate dehydrogenase